MMLAHITLDTGHVRWDSPRAEVGDAAIAYLMPRLDGGIATEIYDGYVMRVAVENRDAGVLVVELLTPDGRDLVRLTVVTAEPAAAAAWASLRATAPARDQLPETVPAPWCAVRGRRGVAADPASAHWLGDFERCVAWSWIEALSANTTEATG